MISEKHEQKSMDNWLMTNFVKVDNFVFLVWVKNIISTAALAIAPTIPAKVTQYWKTTSLKFPSWLVWLVVEFGGKLL